MVRDCSGKWQCNLYGQEDVGAASQNICLFSSVCHLKIYQLCLILKQFDYGWALRGVEVLWAGLLLARAWLRAVVWGCAPWPDSCWQQLRDLWDPWAFSWAFSPSSFVVGLYASSYSLCYQRAEKKHEYFIFFSPWSQEIGSWFYIKATWFILSLRNSRVKHFRPSVKCRDETFPCVPRSWGALFNNLWRKSLIYFEIFPCLKIHFHISQRHNPTLQSSIWQFSLLPL